MHLARQRVRENLEGSRHDVSRVRRDQPGPQGRAHREQVSTRTGERLRGRAPRRRRRGRRQPLGRHRPGHDLSAEVEALAPYLAKLLTERLVDALGEVVVDRGVWGGAIVGTAGEVEHAGALIHTPYFGNLMRDFLEGPDRSICFADTRADAGQSLDRADVAQDPTPPPEATTRPS